MIFLLIFPTKYKLLFDKHHDSCKQFRDELWRESWSVLDRLSEEEGRQRILLLDKVVNFELLFLDAGSINAEQSPLGGEWVEEWDSSEKLPAAVEIMFEVENFGEVRRVFSILSE